MAVPGESLADVTERLFREFEPRVSLRTIVTTVRQCRSDLERAGNPQPALPELIERLARQRLTELAAQPPTPSDSA
jgi:hypothetical protein